MDTVRLSPRLFFFIGSGIIYADTHYSHPLLYTAGRDSWLAMLLGGLAAMILIGWVGTRVIRCLPAGTVYLLPRSMPGMFGWRVLLFLTAWWAWCIAAWGINRYTEFIQSEMMPLTPANVFLVSLIFITAWGGIYGPEAGGRVITLCSLIIFPIPFIYAALLLKQVHAHWLLPIGQEEQFWDGCRMALSLFLQAAPLCVLFQLVDDRRKALRAFLVGLSLSVLVSTIVRIIVIGVLNPYLAPYYSAPDYAAIRLIRLTETFNRVELPLVWFWSYTCWARVLLYFLLGTFALLSAFGMKRWNGAHLVSVALFAVITFLSYNLRSGGRGLVNWLETHYVYDINLGFQLFFLIAVTGLALWGRRHQHPAPNKKPRTPNRWT